MIRFIHFGFQGPSKSLASKLRSNERLFFRQRNRPCSFDTNKQTRQKGTCKLVVDADCFLKLLSVSTFGKIISSQYTISKTWKPSIVSFGLTFTSQKTTTMTFAFNTPPPLSSQKNHHPNFADHASLQHSRDVALTLWFCSDWMPWRPETNGFPANGTLSNQNYTFTNAFFKRKPHTCGGRLGTANMLSSNIPRKI